MTPGIAAGVGNAGAGGASVRGGPPPPPPMLNGCGFFEHLSSTAASPGFCQDCWLLPRAKAEDGLCAAAVATAPQPKSTARASVVFIVGPLGGCRLVYPLNYRERARLLETRHDGSNSARLPGGLRLRAAQLAARARRARTPARGHGCGAEQRNADRA